MERIRTESFYDPFSCGRRVTHEEWICAEDELPAVKCAVRRPGTLVVERHGNGRAEYVPFGTRELTPIPAGQVVVTIQTIR